MDILRDDFCVDISAPLNLRKFRVAASRLYESYKKENPPGIQYDYFSEPLGSYTGYFKGTVEMSTHPWCFPMSVNMYVKYVDDILGTGESSIDNFSII